MFAIGLGCGHLQPDDEREVRMAEREPAPADARDTAAEDMELLAGDRLRGVGKEGEVDVRHLRMLVARLSATSPLPPHAWPTA